MTIEEVILEYILLVRFSTNICLQGAVDRGFDSQSCQLKDYETGSCCFSA